MASAGLNVLRYGALAYGVGYGFTHQKSIYASDRAHKEEQDKQHQESLRKKALQAWDEKQHPELYAKPGNGVIENPDDPKFDLEAYLKSRESSK